MVGFEAWLIEASLLLLLGMETLLLLLEETGGLELLLLAEMETEAETVTEAEAKALWELRKKKAVNSRNNLAI